MPDGRPQSDSARRAEQIHDFAGKLHQEGMLPSVLDYVRWQRAVRKAKKEGGAVPPAPDLVPLSINLDLTTACNYKCDHCIDWDILNSKVRHADDDLRSALKEMAERGLRSVILIGGGEPTLYPGFPSMVKFLKELGLQISVVSNGSKGDKLLAAAQYFTKGDWVRLSLDSGSNDVFQRMHNPSPKTLTLDEICSWIPKIRAAAPDLDLGFSFVITWKGSMRDDVKVVENIHEIVAGAKRAKESGFTYISYKPFLVRTEDGSEVMDPEGMEARLQEVIARIRASIDEARQLEGDGFRVMESTNLRMLMQQSWEEWTHQPKMCHMQALRQVVTPLGIYNCPAHRGVEKARIAEKDGYKDQDGIQKTSFATGFLLDKFDASQECKEVTCLYNKVNWWLEELVESDVDLDRIPVVEDRGDTFL